MVSMIKVSTWNFGHPFLAEGWVGSLTLLFQRARQPGLEILGPDQSWSPVPVFPPGSENDDFPPILVNIGDLLNYWTNGLLMSTVHRVVFPPDGGDDRYSIAYFCHPANDTELVPVPSQKISSRDANDQQGIRRKHDVSNVLTAEQHLKFRLAATYGWGR